MNTIKTYIPPTIRLITLYEEAELMQTSEMEARITDENADESDKSNRRTNIWDE